MKLKILNCSLSHSLLFVITSHVNDPLFSKEAIDEYNKKRSSRQENTKKKISAFVTSSTKDDKRLKCHISHVEKVLFWIRVNIS